MTLQEYGQAQKSSANAHSKLVVCSQKSPWYNQLFVIYMCSLHQREVVFLRALLSEVPLGTCYTCPQSTSHTLIVHLTQLGRTREVNTIAHPQLRDNSVLTSLEA